MFNFRNKILIKNKINILYKKYFKKLTPNTYKKKM